MSVTHHVTIAALWFTPAHAGTPDLPVWRSEMIHIEPQSPDDDYPSLAANKVCKEDMQLLSKRKTEHGYLLTFKGYGDTKYHILIGARTELYDEFRHMEEQLQDALKEV